MVTIDRNVGINEPERPPSDRRRFGSVAHTSFSSRTHLVIQEIERLKSQNEKLKRASRPFQLQRLPYNEKQYAADTKAHREEIKLMIMKAQELDLCFLLDATASMQVRVVTCDKILNRDIETRSWSVPINDQSDFFPIR